MATKLEEHKVAPPEGWSRGWIERDLPALNIYISAISIFLGLAVILIQLRGIFSMRRAQKELATNPSDRAAIFKKIHDRALKTDNSLFKIAIAFMANTVLLALVDGGIAVLVLANDASENPDVWDKEMFTALALYCVYILGLFLASFVLIPLLQMYAVTWYLTRFSRKNVLAEYVPQARTYSTIIALSWAAASFMIITQWSVVGSSSDETSTRFVFLEGAWGSAIAWLEAAFLFNFMASAIGDKDVTSDNNVTKIVSMFAKAATVSFSSKSKQEVLPRYEAVAQDEPLDR